MKDALEVHNRQVTIIAVGMGCYIISEDSMVD